MCSQPVFPKVLWLVFVGKEGDRKAGQRPVKLGVVAGPEEKVPDAARPSAMPEAPLGGGRWGSSTRGHLLREVRSPLGQQRAAPDPSL